jgi:CBS domain-containing protein
VEAAVFYRVVDPVKAVLAIRDYKHGVLRIAQRPAATGRGLRMDSTMDVRYPGGSYLAPSLEHATAADAMRPRVLTCTPDTPLVTAAQRMAAEHVHALVVLREHDGDPGAHRPWAVLGDRDLLRHAAEAESVTAGEAASEAVVVAEPRDALTEVAERMVRHGVSHAVVADPATGRPIGMISTLDIAGVVGWGRA